MQLTWRYAAQLIGTSKKSGVLLSLANNRPRSLLFSALVLALSGCNATDLAHSSTSIATSTSSGHDQQPSSSTPSSIARSSSSQSAVREQPKAFNIPDIHYASAGVELLFDPIEISGIQSTIEIYSDLGEISIDDGDYVKAPQTISNGQQFRLKITAPSQSDSEIIATLRAGSYSTQHTIRTVEDGQFYESSKRDSDGDGSPDIADHAPHNANYQYTFEWAEPSLSYISHPINQGHTAAVAADFNQDGLTDIAQVAYTSGSTYELQWAQGLSPGNFSEFKTLSPLEHYSPSQDQAELRLKVITQGQTGKPQVVVLGPQATLWEMVANQWQSTPLAPFASSVTQTSGQLFSFHAYTLSTPLASNSRDCHFNDTSSGHPHLETANLYGNHDFIVAFDFSFPLLLGSFENGQLECFTDNQDYYTYLDALLKVDFYSRQYAVSDIDNDGNQELIASYHGKASQHPTGLSIIDMEPGKNFYEQAIWGYNSLDTSTRVTSADISDRDGDGDDDIIGLQYRTLNNESKTTIFVFENLGGRRFAANYLPLSEGVDYSNHLSLVDINNDGLEDIFTGSHWLEQQPDIIRYTHIHKPTTIALEAIGDNITYQLHNAPTGITINTNTGLLSVAARELESTINFRLSASDGITTRHRVIRIIAKDSDDIDGDGVSDSEDLYPHNRAESGDFDGDGIADNSDNDKDNDGVTTRLDIDDFNPSIHTPVSWPNLRNSFERDSSAIIEAEYWVKRTDDLSKVNNAQVIQTDEALHLFDPINGQGDASLLYQIEDDCRIYNSLQHADQLFFIERCGTVFEGAIDLMQVSINSKLARRIPWPTDKPSGLSLSIYSDQNFGQGFLILTQNDRSNDDENSDNKDQLHIFSTPIDGLSMNDGASANDVVFKQYDIEAPDSGLDLSDIYASDIILSDINKDGNFDVVIPNSLFSPRGNYAFINEGNTFTYKYFDALRDVRISSLSGSHNYQKFTISNLKGRFFTSGDLSSNYSLITAPNNVRDIVDYNQDGIGDYITGDGLMQNTLGDSTFVTQEVNGRSLSIAALGDFNNDGIIDLIDRYTGAFNTYTDTLYLQVPQQTFEATAGSGLVKALNATIADQQIVNYHVNTSLDAQYFEIDADTGTLSFYVTSTQHNQRLADGFSGTYHTYITAKSQYSQATQLIAVTVSNTD